MVTRAAFVPDSPAPVTTLHVLAAPPQLPRVQFAVPPSNSGFRIRLLRAVGVAVGGTGVFVRVGVAVGGTEVFVGVGVAVGGIGVLVRVGVAVGGAEVFVGVAVGPEPSVTMILSR